MALNFRLLYKTSSGYTDLFPSGNVQTLIGAESNYSIEELIVTIPAIQNIEQNIIISTNNKMINAVTKMFLVSGDIKDYNTISQFEVTNNNLNIIRLGTFPQQNIQIKLVFYERID